MYSKSTPVFVGTTLDLHFSNNALGAHGQNHDIAASAYTLINSTIGLDWLKGEVIQQLDGDLNSKVQPYTANRGCTHKKKSTQISMKSIIRLESGARVERSSTHPISTDIAKSVAKDPNLPKQSDAFSTNGRTGKNRSNQR